MKSDMIIWQELLEASGGKLELSKCFYYILTWSFDSEGNASHDTIEHQQSITDQIQIPHRLTGQQINIEQKEPGESHKTLGCYKSMTGCEQAQIDYLKDKAGRYAIQVKNAGLTRKQARMAYNAMFIPSLRYGLPSCSIKKSDIETIQKYAVEQFLSAIGYEKKFPRAMVFASPEYGGLNLPHLYTEMIGLKLETLLANIRANTELGKAIMININTIQLISGISQPIFESKEKLSYIEDNWIMHLRDFLLEIGGTIELPKAWQHKPQRQHDVLLMDKFIRAGYTTGELRLINNWRKYFQVNTLADICEPTDIARIQECFLKQPMGKTWIKKNTSKLNWPVQSEPGPKGFTLWYSAIKNTFQLDKKSNYIQHKLGKWNESHLLYNNWSTYYDIKNSRMISSNNDNIFYRQLSRVTTTSAKCEPEVHQLDQLPLSNECIPSELKTHHNHDTIMFSKHDKQNYINHNVEVVKIFSVNNYKAYHKTLSQWEQILVKHLVIKIDNKELSNALTKNKAIIISTDGGMYQRAGTFGVNISNGSEILIENKGKSYMNEFYQSSFRAELYGILAGLTTIKVIYDFYKIDPKLIDRTSIYCDNKKVIERIRDRRKFRRTTNQHCFTDYDIEAQVLEIIYELERNTTITFKHIQGKQDRIKPPIELCYAAQMNVAAHNICNSARTTASVTYYDFPTATASFYLNDDPVYANSSKIAKRCYHNIAPRVFLKDKYAWSESTARSVWWQPQVDASDKLSVTERVIIQKFMHNRLPTRKRENYRYTFKCKNCAHCKHEIVEDENHIIKCQFFSREQIRKQWIEEMETYLSTPKTPTIVKDAILLHFSSWLEPPKEPIQQLYDKHNFLDSALSMQQNIGWDNFARGRLASEWGRLINRHIQFNNIISESFNAESWGASLIAINFKYILLLWAQRNKEEHGESVNDLEIKKKEKLLEEVRYIKQLSLRWSGSDYKYIPESIKELEEKTSHQLEVWLISARILQSIHSIDSKEKAKNNKQRLTNPVVEIDNINHIDIHIDDETMEQHTAKDLATVLL